MVFDIETTGGNPERNGITEIFALRYKDGKVLDTFESMVNPLVPIPPIVRRMTGITNKMVKDAPLIEEVMPKFVEFIGNDVLVSHNTIGDMKFLRYFSGKVCGEMIANYYLCSHLLVEKLVSEAPDKSLKGLAEFFELPADSKLHRAKADAYLTLELLMCLQKRMTDAGLKTIVDGIRLQGDYESGLRLGWGIKAEEIQAIPRSSGVFYLYDYMGKMTYLSAASDLHREVKKLQRLSALPKQLLRAVLGSVKITYETTESSFAASILEAEGIAKSGLRFDPANWHQRTANFLYLKVEDDGYRLATGPLSENVAIALGPVRGGRDVTTLLEQYADLFESKLQKKGIKLGAKEGLLLQNFLRSKVGSAPSLLGRVAEFAGTLFSLPAAKALRQKLEAIPIPRELKSMNDCSAVIVVPPQDESEQSLLYGVASGLPCHAAITKTKYPECLSDEKSRKRIIAAIQKDTQKFQSSYRLLPQRESLIVNRLVWWTCFGPRHEDVKVFTVNSLKNFDPGLT